MKVLLQAPLSQFSGYGADGIGIARAFTRLGADVYVMPSSVQAPLPPEVALLLTKETRAPFDLTLIHVDPGAMEATSVAQDASGLLVGWTMWEYSNLKNAPRRTSMKKRWKHFDAMVGYDEVTSTGLADYYDGPILTQQGGYWPEDWPFMERDWDDPRFFFCQIGLLSERKDPFVSIQAFSELSHEHADFAALARLSLKTTSPGLHMKMEDVYPGLRIFYDAWPVSMVKEFYRANHVLLAPSRGEGKNMPALEFLSSGGTVIATNWGGHTTWLDPAYAFAIDYTLAPVSPAFPTTLNARASVEHLKSLMLYAFRHREQVRAMGEAGSKAIPVLSSWENVLIALMAKLEALPEGVEVAAKFAHARAAQHWAAQRIRQDAMQETLW